jgi:hypothetical protein
MSAPDPVRQLALEWMSYAQGDMSAARTLANSRADNVPATSAFHAHQAVEKAIKALLVAAQVPFQKEHDLSLLMGLVPSGRFPRVHQVRGPGDPQSVCGRHALPDDACRESNEPQRWPRVERR